ncbi:MAG: multidrug effflux MFS transporter [Pseudomonadota bacterium]
MSETAAQPYSETRIDALGGMRVPEFVLMVAGLMALNALAIDIMLPALDDMAGSLDAADGNQRQLVIYVYLLGFGVTQLVFGPLSDRYGRRPVLFFSLIGYALTAAACMVAPSFGALLAARFVQGVFAAGGRVVAVSIVRDIFGGRAMARIMSLVMTIFMAVPILAPSIGQLILYAGPWQAIFGALTVWAVLIGVWCALRLPETLPPENKRPLNARATADAYRQVLTHRVTFGYTAASGVVFGALFAFIGASEQLFREVFDKEQSFVLWFALVAGSLSVANLVNSRMVERYGMRRLSHVALIAFIALATILYGALTAFGERFEIFFPLFILMFACFGMMGSNFNALAMEPQGKIAGTASALLGFSSTTVASLIGWMIGRQYDGSSLPIIAGFFLLGVASLAIIAITERGRLFASR